jgi:hypothetical protein
MSPTYYSKFAERAFPVRWWLGGFSIAGVILVLLLATYADNVGMRLAALFAGPLIGLPWAALCAGVWFHPVRGNMQPSSKLVGRLPGPLQTGVRWYAAIFLSIFAFVCAVAWPLFALSIQ